MNRTMNSRTLNDYLSSAQTTVMLCRAHAENFALSSEEIADAQLQIEMQIADLETLCNDIRAKNLMSLKRENVIQLVSAR